MVTLPNISRPSACTQRGLRHWLMQVFLQGARPSALRARVAVFGGSEALPRATAAYPSVRRNHDGVGHSWSHEGNELVLAAKHFDAKT